MLLKASFQGFVLDFVYLHLLLRFDQLVLQPLDVLVPILHGLRMLLVRLVLNCEVFLITPQPLILLLQVLQDLFHVHIFLLHLREDIDLCMGSLVGSELVFHVHEVLQGLSHLVFARLLCRIMLELRSRALSWLEPPGLAIKGC